MIKGIKREQTRKMDGRKDVNNIEAASQCLQRKRKELKKQRKEGKLRLICL